MKKIIEVSQKPIIEYSIIDEVAKNIEVKIESLSIETLESTEDNLSVIKSTRSELNRDFKALEEQRKIVKDIVLKDYSLFEEKYKKMILSKFKEADATLKSMVDRVSDGILKKKVHGISSYFDGVNTFEFLKFEDIGLKIIKSISDKKLKDEIDAYIESVKTSLSTIETLPNKERVLAKYQASKDLNDAIAQTNMEMQREEKIRQEREEREKVDKERKNRSAERQSQMQSVKPKQHVEPELKEEEPKIFKSSFTVYGTKDQLADLKEFMDEKGVRYE